MSVDAVIRGLLLMVAVPTGKEQGSVDSILLWIQHVVAAKVGTTRRKTRACRTILDKSARCCSSVWEAAGDGWSFRVCCHWKADRRACLYRTGCLPVCRQSSFRRQNFPCLKRLQMNVAHQIPTSGMRPSPHNPLLEKMHWSHQCQFPRMTETRRHCPLDLKTHNMLIKNVC